MDTHHATIIGRADANTGEFSVLGHVSNAGAGGNSSEHTIQNQAWTMQSQFFREILNLIILSQSKRPEVLSECDLSVPKEWLHSAAR